MKKKIATAVLIIMFSVTAFTLTVNATEVTTNTNNGIISLDGVTNLNQEQTQTEEQTQEVQNQTQIQSGTDTVTQQQEQTQTPQTEQQSTNTTPDLKNDATVNLVELKDRELETLQDYQDSYGDDTYGLVAYILNIIRLYSIPFGFVGIAISGIYRYIIGIRKLDVRDKGFGAMVGIITVMVICQILPLIFAIVVKGWRG